ncbi:Nucleosome assembly protein [Balamuthia mandrillaris]
MSNQQIDFSKFAFNFGEATGTFILLFLLFASFSSLFFFSCAFCKTGNLSSCSFANFAFTLWNFKTGINLNAGLVNSLQAQLGGLVGQSSGYLESLPKSVQDRVEALRNLDQETVTLEKAFEEEVRKLEEKYHELYRPLFQKRAEIVAGTVEVEPSAKTTEEKKTEGEENKPEEPVVGIPDFWSTTLRSHPLFASVITEQDQPILSHLRDITFETLADELGSFVLNFHFNENEYFEETLLSKTYHIDDSSEEEIMCDSIDATQITWKAGKNVTEGTQGMGEEKGSFFNFFSPPNLSEDKKPSKKEEHQMGLDFEMAVLLKTKIIPHAVNWFTGDADVDDEEALNFLNFNAEDYNSDEDEDYEPEDDDDEDGEGQGKETPECKQQ